MEGNIILTWLLDKYEKSMHCNNPGVSKKRVMLQIARKHLPEYDFENAAVRDAYNQAALALQKEGLVHVTLVSGRPVIEKITLNLEQIHIAYQKVGKTHPTEKANQACNIICDVLADVKTEWISRYASDFIVKAKQHYSLPKYCDDLDFFEELIGILKRYDSIAGKAITVRAFSLLCFQDSKRFEREFQDEFLFIARAYATELIELLVQQEAKKLGAREEFACLGIYARTEMYELAGNFSVIRNTGVMDVEAFSNYGIGITSNCVDGIISFDLKSISMITFIENKTNYDEYILDEKLEHELVIYHGGFSSPKKTQLFQILARSINSNMSVFFWADIDMGGFRMFKNLQRIFPALLPKRMSADDVRRYASCGLVRSDEYLEKLSVALKKNEFPIFKKTIEEILKFGVTIEQEIFLV